MRTLPLFVIMAGLHGLLCAGTSRAQPIDVHDPSSWERPVLIAHRGGVITPEAAENTAAALRLAAEEGFAMVEIDVRETADHVPVTFHDGNLSRATGVDARVEELRLEELMKVRHRNTGQRILTLDEALELCAAHELGVMLDIKSDGSEAFFRDIAALVQKHGLTRSAITFYDHPLARKHLDGLVMFALTDYEESLVRRGEAADLAGTFWFGLPRELDAETIHALQERGALVIPAINIFRYDRDRHMEEAEADVERMMAAGVDGFQIDSIYLPLFRKEDGTAR